MHVKIVHRNRLNNLNATDRIGRDRTMLDVIMLAIGLGFFALALSYTYACDRL
jgi:hypothetical protein